MALKYEDYLANNPVSCEQRDEIEQVKAQMLSENKMRRYIEGSLRKRYINAHSFNKVSVLRIRPYKVITWVVVGPGLRFEGECYGTFTEALTFANSHAKKLEWLTVTQEGN